MPSPAHEKLRILALEPYSALSHRRFLDGLAQHSRHEIRIETLPARKWKWRMRTAALHFAPLVADGGSWDLLFVSDYFNLSELRALLPAAKRDIPALIYFHENQLTYPLQEEEARDYHYAFTHLYSILTATAAVFNSEYHRREFLAALPALLRLVPDMSLLHIVRDVEARASVLPLGIELPAVAPRTQARSTPVILWNHRWEYDKNPGAFLDALLALAERGTDFQVLLLGQRFRSMPADCAESLHLLGKRIREIGFTRTDEEYRRALASADLVVSTAIHEFFGLGTLEAMRSGALPVLPDDLAYPELLPSAERDSGRFLYRREAGLLPALERALAVVRAGEWKDIRENLVKHTETFTWERVAPRYDELFERLAAKRP